LVEVIRIAKLLLALLSGMLCAAPVTAQNPAISIEQFDAWIFQGLPGRGQATREAIESRVDQEILRISRAITLEDAQTSRLKLAGKGDVKRFFDRVDKARRQFLAMQDRLERNNLNEAYQLAMPLQQELTAGLFGPKSLLQKSIPSTLDEQQMEAWQREIERSDRVRAERAVTLFIAQMQRQVPMTADQRTRLAELLNARVKSVRTTDRYTPYLIQYRMSEVPRETFVKMFDVEQMKAIDHSIRQGQAMGAMVRQRGLLDD
jgi:hypothetical protein